MCGIVGFHNFNRQQQVDVQLIKKMCETIVHRGPDDEGIYTNQNVGLGMRRLSIIDLNTGEQPIYNEDKSVVIVFNGEIYNFIDLRNKLVSAGHRFASKTDTETIVHGYEEYGVDILENLNGMFAFAIWDDNRKLLFVVRDRIGIKPLYYYCDNEKLVFASEIKAIIKHKSISKELNKRALPYFMSYGYVPAPMTMFKGIHKLPPGHYMLVEHGDIKIHKYWDVQFHNDKIYPFEYYRDRVFGLLKQSIKRRLVSDVPLGAFLSGGMDSGSIVTIMSELTNSPINTYSIGFGGDNVFHNELDDAKSVALRLKTNHHELLVEPNVIELLPELIYYMDEPVADSSIIVTYLVSKFASDTVKVILSGVGGDELFGGYRRYLGYTLNRYYSKVPGFLKKHFISSIFKKLPADRNSSLMNLFRLSKAYILSAQLPESDQYHNAITIFNDDFRQELFSQNIIGGIDLHHRYFSSSNNMDYLSKILYFDMKTQLVDQLLLLTDKMSMAASIEARVPFLDHELVEFAAKIPSRYKVNGFQLRYVQKEAMKKILPLESINKKKMGFGCPIGKWIRNDLHNYVLDLLSKETVDRRGYFNYAVIKKILNDHFNKRADYTDHIFALIIFEMWHRAYLN